MNESDMITTTGYTALRDFNLADAMRDELGGMDITFDRVTIPAAGGTTFELPGALPGETDAVKEFTGVIGNGYTADSVRMAHDRFLVKR